jgi:c-di-GMP-binding flagellar brake protein YcgR
MKKVYGGIERRQFVRLDFMKPLNYKVCKKKTISSLLSGYTSNISQSGLLCKIQDRVREGDILWLMFDRATLNICEELEKKVLIYQNGIIGQVVRVKPGGNKSYDVGLRFITRVEKNLTNIYPKIHFLKDQSENKNEEA